MNNTIIWNRLMLLAVGLVFAVACKDDDAGDLNLERNFTPAVVEVTEGETQAVVEWSRSLFAEAGDVEYQIEVSKDGVDFSNIEFTGKTTELEYTLTDADIDIKVDYFARIKVLAKGSVGESGYVVSEAFQITGEQIFLPLAESDVIDNGAILSWQFTDGITTIIVTPEGGSPVEHTVSEDESNAAQKLIGNLTGSTNYTAEIFKGDVAKGTITFTTKASLEGDNIIDLRNVTDNPDILMETLATDFADGSIIVLKRGLTYNLSSTQNIDRSFTILSGADFIPELATIFFTSNFNLTASANVGSVIFKDLYMYSDNFDGRYVFNINQVGTIGKVEFQNCRIHKFRGVLRMQTGGAGTQITDYVVNNCVADSLREYAMATTNNSNAVANIKITNSTFYNTRRFIDHRSPGSNSIDIEDCTFFNVVTGGLEGAEPNYFIDLNTNMVATPIIIKNCIFGKGWNEGAGDYVRGLRAGAGTTLSVTNSYSTSDYLSTNAPYQLSGILAFAGTSYSIFADPDNGDFTIINGSFPGNDNAGDPRWRQD